MALQDAEVVPFEQFQYETQSISVDLGGESHSDIYRFLSQLHLKAPNFFASNVSLEGFGGSPSAKVTLQFYLAPELVSEAQEE